MPTVLFYLILIFRSAFNITIKGTPTSPKTAIHIFATPKRASIIIKVFTIIAKAILNLTLDMIVFAHFIPFTTMSIVVPSITASAVSTDISAPVPPTAIPISATESTGASLIPSPTNAVMPSWFSCLIFLRIS